MVKNERNKDKKSQDPTNNNKPKRTKKTKVTNPSNGIDKSQKLLRSSQKRRARGKQSLDKRNALNLVCGKPMPPLSELEKMYEGSDEEMPETTSASNSTEGETPDQQSSPISNGVMTRTAAKKYADELLKILNGNEAPQPIIPMKKYKKPEVPYIVGCTERPRIPENPNCNVFKGDDYGISSKTNALTEDEDGLKTPGFYLSGYSLSKSIFNAQANEIASNLLSMENNSITRGSDSDDTVVYELNSPKSRFSPEPSTSKDSETILKNDQKFIQSFVDSNISYDEIDDKTEQVCESSVNEDNLFKMDIEMKDNKSEDVNPKAQQTILELSSNNVTQSLNSSHDDIEIIEQPCEIVDIDDDDYTNIDVKTKSSTGTKRENRKNNSDSVVDRCEIKDMYKTKAKIECSTKNKDNTRNINDSPIVIEDDPFDPKIIAEIDLTNINVDDVIFENKSLIDKYSKRNILTAVNVVEANVPKPILEKNTNARENIGNMQLGSKYNQTNLVQTRNDPHLPNKHNEMEQILKKFFEKWGHPNISHNQANNKSITLSDQDVILPDFSQMFVNSQSVKTNNQRKNKNINESTNNLCNYNNLDTPREPFLGTCPICLDDLSRQAVGSTNCGHLFCMPCITKALKIKPKRCPTCRKKLTGQGYHQIYM